MKGILGQIAGWGVFPNHALCDITQAYFPELSLSKKSSLQKKKRQNGGASPAG